jgi:hypothetical protein
MRHTRKFLRNKTVLPKIHKKESNHREHRKISEREIRNPKHEARNNDQNTNVPMIKTSYSQHPSLGHFVI